MKASIEPGATPISRNRGRNRSRLQAGPFGHAADGDRVTLETHRGDVHHRAPAECLERCKLADGDLLVGEQ